MAKRDTTFLLKRSNVAGKVPSIGDLVLGEMALNTADVILYTSGTTANAILPIGWDRIHRTGDTMTGNLTIQGDLTVTGTSYLSAITTNYIDFNIAYTGVSTEGRLQWAPNDGGPIIGMEGGQVTQQIGQETYYYIKNQSGATIENGRVVRASGTLGSSGKLLGEYMIADGSILPKYTLGVATEDIINGSDGFVTEFGLVRGIDTTGTPYGETWNDGDILWVSPTIAGGLTNIQPQAPNLKIEIAIVVYANANGSIFVRPHRYPHVHDLQEVNYSGGTESDMDVLQWNSTLSAFTITNTPSFVSVSATTISATTYYGDGSNLSGITTTDSYVTGVTINNGLLTLERNNALPDLTASTVTPRTITFNSSDMALNTASRVTLTPLVMSVTKFAGTGAIDDAGITFSIPQDYKNSPQFYFTWRAASTSANKAKIYLSIYSGDTGGTGSLTTAVETLGLTGTPTTANAFLYSTTATSSLTLSGDDTLHVRIYRDPADVNDTFTGDLDMINLVFKYNSTN